MRRVLLFVDFSNLLYKSVHAYAALTYGNTFTGGVYGVLVQLAAAANETSATHIVICGDSPPYLRKSECPQYKSDRKNADEFVLQRAAQTKALCRELFLILGAPFWEVETFEADDCIAWGVERDRNRFDQLVAVSNDSDLFQLFRYRNFSVFRGRKGIYKPADFITEYGPNAIQDWVVMTAMTGTHNAVPGIKGVGPVTASKIVADLGRKSKFIADNLKLITRNESLIKLPHPKFLPAFGMGVSSTGYSERRFIRFASSLGITVTEKMQEAFRRTQT